MFRYSLLSLMCFVLLCSALMVLAHFHVVAAVMLGIVAVGAGGAVAAARAQLHRLAHFIMAFVCGVFWYAGLSLPITPLGMVLWEFFSSEEFLPSFLILLLFCGYSLLVGVILRFTRLQEPAFIPWRSIRAAALAFSAPVLVGSLGVAGIAVGIAMFLSLPVLTLLAGVMAVLLRSVGDAAHEAFADEFEVYAAVERLEMTNRNSGRLSIFPEELSRYVGQDQQAVARHLEQLIRKGYLGYTPREGYFLMKRHA